MVQNAESRLVLAALLEPDVITDPIHQPETKLPLVEICIATRHVLAMRREMRAHEAERAVHQFEANGRTALIAHHAQKTRRRGRRWELHAPNTPTHHLLQTRTKRLADEHAQEHTHQNLMLHKHIR